VDTFQVTVDPVAAEGLTAAVNAALAQAGVSDRIRAELIETPDLQSLLDAISGDLYVAATKAALELIGMPVGNPRGPRLPFPEAKIPALKRVLADLGVLTEKAA